MEFSRGTSLYLLDLAVCALYVATGVALTRRARRYLKNPKRIEFHTSLYSPDAYSPEGQRLRKRALAFWLLGALALAVYFAAWWLAQDM